MASNEMLRRLQNALDQCRYGGLVRMNEPVYDLGAGCLYVRHPNTQLFSGLSEKLVKIVSTANTLLVVCKGAHNFNINGVSLESLGNSTGIKVPKALVVIEENVNGVKMNDCNIRWGGKPNGGSSLSNEDFGQLNGLLIEPNAEALLCNVNVCSSNGDGLRVAEGAKLHATKCSFHENVRHGIFLHNSGFCEFLECKSFQNGKDGVNISTLSRAAFLFSRIFKNGRNGIFLGESEPQQWKHQDKDLFHVIAHCEIQENGKGEAACGIAFALNLPVTLEGNSIGPHPKASLWFKSSAANPEKGFSKSCMIVANRFGGNVIVDKPLKGFNDALYEVNDFLLESS